MSNPLLAEPKKKARVRPARMRRSRGKAPEEVMRRMAVPLRAPPTRAATRIAVAEAEPVAEAGAEAGAGAYSKKALRSS